MPLPSNSLDPELTSLGLTAERVQYFQTKAEGLKSEGPVFIGAAIAALVVASIADKKSFIVVLGLCFWIFIFVGHFISGQLDKVVIRRRELARTSAPDYGQFLKYQAAVAERARIADDIRQREDARRREAERETWRHEERWKKLDGWEFERALSRLLGERGWSADLTKGSGDEGIDIILTVPGKTVVVQCKAHGKFISPAPVRELYGTLMHHGASEAWLVTTSGFNRGARAFAKGKPIKLLTIKDILGKPELTSP